MNVYRWSYLQKKKKEFNIVCLSWCFLKFWKYLHIMITTHVLHSEYTHKS